MKKAASSVLKRPAGVKHVSSGPTLDSEGHESLQVTIVPKRGSVAKIDGDKALEMLVSIDRALRAANEERFPIIEYVTEE